MRNAIEIGDERTFGQDPKYAIRLVVDIAIKALSPVINDLTTAAPALDEIRYCGAYSVQVMRRMNALIKNLLGVLPAARHAEFQRW